MTGPGVARRVAHPLLPVALLAPAAVATALAVPVLTWAVVGGLAGYTLSGSV